MGLIKAFSGAISGTLGDQWLDIVNAGTFDEHTVVAPGVFISSNNGRGSNTNGSVGVISKGSKILVPENTAAFIFSQGGIEEIVSEPGGYIYQNGEESVFNGKGLSILAGQVKDRFKYGGQPSELRYVAFVNLREIREIKFGTNSPVVYNDKYYGTDLEITARGVFSIKILDPVKFLRNFVPANTNFYSFDDGRVRAQIIPEFVQSFIVALNSMSESYRISQLPAHAEEISEKISRETTGAGSWNERFGFIVIKTAVFNIEMTPESKELVKQYSANKMNMKAYEDISLKTSNIVAQQNISQGVKEHGLGDGAGMIFGMNMGAGMTPQGGMKDTTASFDQQIEMLKKLKDLLDAGVLTQEEFDLKKKEVLGL